MPSILEHALGVGMPGKPNHPAFETDEAAIVTGVVTLAYAAFKYWELED